MRSSSQCHSQACCPLVHRFSKGRLCCAISDLRRTVVGHQADATPSLAARKPVLPWRRLMEKAAEQIMEVMGVLLPVFGVFIPALLLPGPDFVGVVRSSM